MSKATDSVPCTNGQAKPEVTVRTWGIYSKWESGSRTLPDFVESTDRIPAEIDIEFGMVVHVKGAKNLPLNYCIDHPGIRDKQGRRRAAFRGTEFVKDNDWDFYLGDTIWAPIDDKIGRWTMTLELQDRVVAQQSFDVVPEHQPAPEPQSRPLPRHHYRLVWISGL